MTPEDRAYLERLVRDGRTKQRIARRARILLSMAEPATKVQEVVVRLGQTRMAIWYVCRRYERLGVAAVEDAPRSGRPRAFSPSAACRN
jgi:hypothetical protein